MNDDLIAECVINNLVRLGFIHNNQEWQHHNTRELYYPVSFYRNVAHPSTVSFIVTVKDGIHRISKISLQLLERRFSENFDTVFVECVVPVINH